MNSAFLLGRVEPTHETEILNEFEKLDFVEKASLVYGKHDLVVRIFGDGLEKVKQNQKELEEISGLRFNRILMINRPGVL